MTGTEHPGLQVGELVEVRITAVAHGGHVVARHEGQVLFVRHALPGELVRARVTGQGSGGRFVRADAVEILEPSDDRVEPPCPFAGPDRCGGCDYQHVSLPAQRRLKAAVVAEQLSRIAGIEREVVCEALPGESDGLGWRTRVEVAVAHPDGGIPYTGLRAHRSHRVVPVDECRIAHPGVLATGVFRAGEPGAPRGVEDLGDISDLDAIDAVAPSAGDPVAVPLRRDRPRRPQRRGRGRQAPLRPTGPVPTVTERVAAPGPDGAVTEHSFTLSARGFWQVHPAAAPTFTAQVLDWLRPRPGERALDLYSGVGLFAVPLAEAVGPTGSVVAVEADEEATTRARGNLAPYRQARAVASPTREAVEQMVTEGECVDVVVLDPPRTGAGAEVMAAVAALRPRAVVHVACDPSALARDLAAAAQHGLKLADLRVLDAFPMTHHVECLALLHPR